MLFARGKRPSANDIERIVDSPDDTGSIGVGAGAAAGTGSSARVSFRPDDDNEGMLELLVSGLTFDLCGLEPGNSMPVPHLGHSFGLPSESVPDELEAVMLYPAQHISGGFAMIPIVQAMIGLARNLAAPLPVEAICWHPARSWMEPQYFARIAQNWLSGGAFPALGLTALVQNAQGVRSEGLDFFAVQELQVDNRDGETMAETAKLAVRFIDHIATHGPFRRNIEFEGLGKERLRIELSDLGRLATVRRQV